MGRSESVACRMKALRKGNQAVQAAFLECATACGTFYLRRMPRRRIKASVSRQASRSCYQVLLSSLTVLFHFRITSTSRKLLSYFGYP